MEIFMSLRKLEKFTKFFAFIILIFSGFSLGIAYITYRAYYEISIFCGFIGIVALMASGLIFAILIRDYLNKINSKIVGRIIISLFYIIVLGGILCFVLYETVSNHRL